MTPVFDNHHFHVGFLGFVSLFSSCRCVVEVGVNPDILSDTSTGPLYFTLLFPLGHTTLLDFIQIICTLLYPDLMSDTSTGLLYDTCFHRGKI